jgi:hypothetical protein
MKGGALFHSLCISVRRLVPVVGLNVLSEGYYKINTQSYGTKPASARPLPQVYPWLPYEALTVMFEESQIGDGWQLLGRRFSPASDRMSPLTIFRGITSAITDAIRLAGSGTIHCSHGQDSPRCGRDCVCHPRNQSSIRPSGGTLQKGEGYQEGLEGISGCVSGERDQERMTVWFTYSFRCPRCRKTVSSENKLEFAPSRDDIPATVYGLHPTCPQCHKPLPSGTIDLLINEAGKQ